MTVPSVGSFIVTVGGVASVYVNCCESVTGTSGFPLLVTTMDTDCPAMPPGVTAVICVSLGTVTLWAFFPPNVTVTPFFISNFSPVIWTVVPPVSGPCVGLIPVGTGSGLQPAQPAIHAQTIVRTASTAIFLGFFINSVSLSSEGFSFRTAPNLAVKSGVVRYPKLTIKSRISWIRGKPLSYTFNYYTHKLIQLSTLFCPVQKQKVLENVLTAPVCPF